MNNLKFFKYSKFTNGSSLSSHLVSAFDTFKVLFLFTLKYKHQELFNRFD